MFEIVDCVSSKTCYLSESKDDHFQIFTEFDRCGESIPLRSTDVRIILITNGNFAERLLFLIHQLRRIDVI